MAEEKPGTPRSLGLSRKGVKTGADFANLMGALMADLIDGSISPEIGSAVVKAGGMMLKVVDMELRLCNQNEPLRLVPPPPPQHCGQKGCAYPVTANGYCIQHQWCAASLADDHLLEQKKNN